MPSMEDFEDDAIGKYVQFMDGGGTKERRRTGDELREKTKEQLLSSGWTFWMATKYDGRLEIRYKAPHGTSYISLVVACKAYQKMMQTPPTSDSKIKTRKRTASSSTNPSKIKKRAADSSINSNSSRKRTSTDDHDQDANVAARVLRPRTADAIVVVASNSCANGSPPDSDIDAGDPPYVAGGYARSKKRRRVSAICAAERAIKKSTKKTKKASTSPANKASVLMRPSENRGGGVMLKQRWSEGDDSDSVCSVCADGGDMVLCDRCPAAYHLACVGLDATPPGDWFCPSCRCAICSTSELDDDDATRLTDKTVIYCDQCERQYHVGCVRTRGGEQHQQQPEPEQVQPWLCSHDCAEVSEHLQGLVGRSTPTSVPGVSFTVLRSSMASSEKKLRAAYSVLDECFVTLIEPRTRSNVTKDILHNRSSPDHLRRLDFCGFYVIGLELDTTSGEAEMVTVGTLRVYAKEVAELPLVGTRFAHRRRGMCRLLMDQLEALLRSLEVERLVLPAVPELLETWTGSFGFQVMTREEKVEIARRQQHTLLCFQGTTMCHKYLT